MKLNIEKYKVLRGQHCDTAGRFDEMPASHVNVDRVLIAAPRIQFPANVPAKAVQDYSSARAPEST